MKKKPLLICLVAETAMAQQARVTPYLSKDDNSQQHRKVCGELTCLCDTETKGSL